MRFADEGECQWSRATPPVPNVSPASRGRAATKIAIRPVSTREAQRQEAGALLSPSAINAPLAVGGDGVTSALLFPALPACRRPPVDGVSTSRHQAGACSRGTHPPVARRPAVACKPPGCSLPFRWSSPWELLNPLASVACKIVTRTQDSYHYAPNFCSLAGNRRRWPRRRTACNHTDEV